MKFLQKRFKIFFPRSSEAHLANVQGVISYFFPVFVFLFKATGGGPGLKKMIKAHIRDLSETISMLFKFRKKR